jgi:hypothetical protein
MKTSRIIFAFVIAVAVATGVTACHPRANSPDSAAPESNTDSQATPIESPAPKIPETGAAHRSSSSVVNEQIAADGLQEKLSATTNKLERLDQIRESFRVLAAGNHTNALRAAKQITNAVERETALLALVTEWTHGELSPPGLRASRISMLGLEAGLGCELAKDPELAILWANELTEGGGRVELLQAVAREMVRNDPSSAFALNEQVPETDRRKFYEALLANWASFDTDAALKWGEQFSDPADREAVVQAIRIAAPVGIGAELRTQDGYPIINGLVPGSPAQLNGQLHPGDRIVGIAQGNSPFINAQDMDLTKVVEQIRGAPGTLLQLQVLPPNAPPNSPPRTITIIRDQIKFKR